MLTMNQKRRAAEARHLRQVRASAAPGTGATHAAGAGDNHAAPLAPHGVRIHADEVKLLRNLEAVPCSGHRELRQGTPTPLGGPRPLFPLLQSA